MVRLAEGSRWWHQGSLDWASAAGARYASGAIGSETHEARTDAMCQSLDQVGETIADVDIVDDALAEGVNSVAEEVETDGYVLLCCAEGKRLQEDDGNTDDAEECSHWGVA